MNRKFFNFKLYKDMLRQLRLLGIILGVLCILASILPVVINYISCLQSHRGTNSSPIPSIAGTAPALLVFMFVGGLSLVFAAFSFLNKRAASDYYHSLPGTRVCTYTSLLASVLTWAYGVIVSTVVVTMLSYAAFGMPFNYAYIPWLLAANLAGITFVVGASVIAVGVTGTRFSNIIVAGLVLFLPRFISLLYAQSVMNIAPIAGANELGLFFDPSANMATGLVFAGSLGMRNPSTMLVNGGGIIYTAVVGIVYIFLGCLLFHFRKSESAGRSAPNKVLQHVYRCAITLPFLLIIAMGFASTRYEGFYFGDNLGAILILFVISLVVYFVFEIITTKKAKNLLTAAPWYLVVLAVALVFAIGAGAMGDAVLHTTPSASEIRYASINVPPDPLYSNYNQQEKSYSQLLTEKIHYDDPGIKQILSDGLKKTVWQIASGVDASQNGNSVPDIFGLTLADGRNITRTIYLSQADHDRLFTLQLQNNEYKASFRMLPQDNEISDIHFEGCSDTDSRDIWDAFKQEVQSLSDADYARVVGSNTSEAVASGDDVAKGMFVPGDGSLISIASFSVGGSVGLENFRSSYNLTALTPRATAMYLNVCFGSYAPIFKSQAEYIAAFPSQPQEGQYYDFNIALLNVKDSTGKNVNGVTFSEGQPQYDDNDSAASVTALSGVTKQVLQIIQQSDLKAGRMDRPMAVISIESDQSSGPSSGYFYIEITDAQAQAIMDAVAGYHDNLSR